MAATTELNKGLVDGLKAAKSKRAYFALVLKGSNDGALLVSKTKVPPADIATAKKQSGGSAVLKGFCQYEDGTYVFETAKPAPATAAQAVKIIAKRDAGLAVKAEFRISTDPELLAEDGDAAIPPTAPVPPPKAAAAAAPPSASQAGADVAKRLNAMTADIKAALAGPNKAQVQSLFVAASGQIKSQKFAEAGKSLDQLAALVKQSASAASPTAAPTGADVAKRLNAMTADIKTALAGPNKARVQSLFVAINGQIKGKEFAAAGAGLDELEQLLKPAADASAGNDDPLAAEWERRVAELNEKVREAQKKRPGEANWMMLYMSAQDLGAEGKFKQAIDILNKIDTLLKSSPQQGSPELTKAIQSWAAARTNVVQQLQAEIAVVVSTKIDAAAADAAELTNLKNQAERELRAVAKQLAALETKQQAAVMRKWLAEDEVVADVCEIGFDLKGPLVGLLDKITQDLRA